MEKNEEEERKWRNGKLCCIEELLNYLTKLNDNIMVYVKKITVNKSNGYKIYEMSNGITCSKNTDGYWFISQL